jgi:hypothetical protein
MFPDAIASISIPVSLSFTCYVPSVLPQLPLSGNLLVYIPYLSTLNKKFPPEFLRLPRACDEFPDCLHVSPLEPWLSRLKAYRPIGIFVFPAYPTAHFASGVFPSVHTFL